MDIYARRDFVVHLFQCPDCGWKGKGTQTHIVDLYGLVEIKEIHCPNCDSTIGGLKEDDADKGNAGAGDFQIGG